MKLPFDIAADLDTPVSAYLKLKSFGPRFLLESVEGGERLGALLLHRLRRRPGVQARRRRAVGRRQRRAHAARPAPSCSPRCATRWRARRKPGPDRTGLPLAGGLVGYAAYDIVRFFERLPSRAVADQPVPGRLLRRAALAAGVRSPDARAVAAARRTGERAPGAAREIVAALRGPLPARAGHVPLRAARRQHVARRVSRRACAACRSTSPPATSTSWCCRCASPASASSIRSRPIARCGCSIPRPTCTYCELGDVTVVGSSPEALVRSMAAARSCGRSPAPGRAARLRRAGPRRTSASCSPTRRRTPST